MDNTWTTCCCTVYLLITGAVFVTFLVVGFPYFQRWLQQEQERIAQIRRAEQEHIAQMRRAQQERIAEMRRLEQERIAEARRLEQERKAHLEFINDPVNFPSLSESDRDEIRQIVSDAVNKRVGSGVIFSALDVTNNGFIVGLKQEFPPPDRVIKPYTTRITKKGQIVQGRKKKDSEFYEEYLNAHVAKQVLQTTRKIFQAHRLIQMVIFSCWTTFMDEYGNYCPSCFLSVAIDRELFEKLNLSNLSPLEALRKFRLRLGQGYDSKLMPIEPLKISNLQMANLTTDKTFMELQNMNPYEFEKFVGHLLHHMGFQTTVTKPSQDGGVDVIAESDEPLKKGKIIVQCKRHRQSVGVSIVRELYGVMNHEGAMKGIIITTSDFTSEAQRFAEGKPIELIDGALLQQLIKRYGIEEKSVSSNLIS